MAGTISLSLSQQLDNLGRPLSGGRLYFYEAGTSAPQNAYIDSALSLAHPNPIILDDAGRVPQFFLADGSIKIRLTDADGDPQISADNVLVVGPSSGEGEGGGQDDPSADFQTGDLKPRYGTGTHTGWVRSNGRTIGSATSGATERANADTEELFIHLWTADSNLSVSGGRGGSALADFNANKTIALPDFRGRTMAGLGDMGSTNAGRLTSTHFGASVTALGPGGAESVALTEAQLATHDHAQTAQTPRFTYANANVAAGGNTAVGTLAPEGLGNTLITTADGTPGDTEPAGSGTPHSSVQPTMLVTIYIKL